MDIRFVYMTAANVDEAKTIGRELVESRLAACVNILPQIHSIYRWEGKIEDATEVVMVAKNKTSSDELIRLILLNREWMKNYEIRKALVTHPKTPLPKALRFVSELTLRDLKDLMRSRNVSNAISTTARKEVERKMKRGG